MNFDRAQLLTETRANIVNVQLCMDFFMSDDQWRPQWKSMATPRGVAIHRLGTVAIRSITYQSAVLKCRSRSRSLVAACSLERGAMTDLTPSQPVTNPRPQIISRTSKNGLRCNVRILKIHRRDILRRRPRCRFHNRVHCMRT